MRRSHVWIVAPSLVVLVGCAPAWHVAYEESVRQARRQDRDLVIFYKDPMNPSSGQMRDVLQSATVRPLLADKVRCMLVPFYEPNRRFVAQFGIVETPALIVMRADSTYHALNGLHDAETVRRFLESARVPGKQPDLDPRIPRRSGFEYYNIFERARDKALRQNRRLVILYKWWLQPESTELIRRVSRPHVVPYFADSVNCILDWDYVPNRRHLGKYGVTSFPTLVIVEPDGLFRTLRGLASVEQIIRFAVSGSSAGGKAAPPRGGG